IPSNQLITFQIGDDLSFELNSLRIYLNGKEFKYGDKEVEVAGNERNYSINLRHNNLIVINQLNFLRITGKDKAGNTIDSQIIFNQPAPIVNVDECKENQNPGPTPTTCFSDSIEISELGAAISTFLGNKNH